MRVTRRLQIRNLAPFATSLSAVSLVLVFLVADLQPAGERAPRLRP